MSVTNKTVLRNAQNKKCAVFCTSTWNLKTIFDTFPNEFSMCCFFYPFWWLVVNGDKI